MRSRIFLALTAGVTILAALLVQCQQPSPPESANKVLLILPFQNVSKAPGLEWIGEAFSEVLGQRMASSSIFVIGRQERLDAFDRAGIPAAAHLSRATLLRIAEQMDVDYVVLGTFDYDGKNFTAKAQLLDMRRLHLSPYITESGSLLQLTEIQAATAWDLMRHIQPDLAATREDYVAGVKDIRLDALENYVRGVTATSDAEKIRRLKEAVRLNPQYSVALLELGKAYFDERDYAAAITWLSKIPESDKHAPEARFFLGLAAYYSGNLDRAADAFGFVVTRLPLTEVYNDLGVVQARRGKKDAVEYFEKAADADPADEDYHFNLGITLARTGETAAAIKQLKDAVSLRPSDNEARNDLETLSAGSSSLSLPRNPERIKRNYDEASFRQLAFAVENAQEETMAHADPQKHAAMYVDMGKQQLSQGFYEEARDHFRKAIALDPANSEAHLGLANAEMALNDLTGARTELTSSLRDKPTADTYIALGQLDLKENNVDAANQDVAEALHLEPGNTAALQLKQQLARLQAKQ